jgi:hypothetical protein
MRRKPSPTADHEADLARFAWGISFFVTLALVVALGLAHSAQARTVPAAVATAAVLPADDEYFEDEAESSEDEGFEAYECDEEIEECDEVDPDEDPGDGPEAPAECVLSSAQATAFAAANHDRIRLQISYKATVPTAVTVDYGLHGSKGALFLGSEKRRVGKKGVLRLTKNLTEPQMAKALAAKEFTVRLRVPEAPRYCASLFDRELDVRQAIPSGLAWEQSE